MPNVDYCSLGSSHLLEPWSHCVFGFRCGEGLGGGSLKGWKFLIKSVEIFEILTRNFFGLLSFFGVFVGFLLRLVTACKCWHLNS